MTATVAAGVPSPAQRADLVGQEEAEAQLLAAIRSGRLPHAWLFGGPRGVGKATLAYRFARFLLAHPGAVGAGGTDLLGEAPRSLYVDPREPVFRRAVAGAHADLMVVERQADERSKRLRNEIVVDQIRGLVSFFNLTSGEGGWRIALIDGADEMNVNAANALLKLLEEPPPRCLLLLVAHAPGRLLATIRSRCRRLTLRPLADAQMLAILDAALPELTAAERLGLARLAEGSPGRALALAEHGGLGVYAQLLELLQPLPKLDYTKVHALGDKLARREQDAAYRVWVDLLCLWLARLVRSNAMGDRAGDEAVAGEGALSRRLAGGRGLDRWVELWEKISHLARRADSVNLDRKQVILNAFLAVEEAARG